LNGNLKAYAAWWLWSRLGGWCGAITGDINQDCIVNFEDFADLAQNWMTENTIGDIAPAPAGDGIVNPIDLRALSENWLTEHQ
jgi:hypothetical protein